MRKREKSGIKKEKIVMLATAAFALTAMTMTGVFVNQKNHQNNQDGYSIDLSSLEEDTSRQITEIGEEINRQVAEIDSDDLDVEINYEEANAGGAKLPGEDISQLGHTQLPGQSSESYTEADAERELAMEEPAELLARIPEDESAEAVNAPAIETKTPTFHEQEGLAWPVVGNVILNYSMDEAVYFKTLNQYRYNPSMVIEAVVGEPITAAADGKVSSIRSDVETGGTLKCDLGNGYELTYGQLTDFTVEEGQMVTKGQIIGYVAEPSIFYTQEGANVYFELTKDGEPVNPMTMLP